MGFGGLGETAMGDPNMQVDDFVRRDRRGSKTSIEKFALFNYHKTIEETTYVREMIYP